MRIVNDGFAFAGIEKKISVFRFDKDAKAMFADGIALSGNDVVCQYGQAPFYGLHCLSSPIIVLNRRNIARPGDIFIAFL